MNSDTFTNRQPVEPSLSYASTETLTLTSPFSLINSTEFESQSDTIRREFSHSIDSLFIPPPDGLEAQLAAPRIPDPRPSIHRSHDKKDVLKQTADNILSIMVPVSLCMTLVIIGTQCTPSSSKESAFDQNIFAASNSTIVAIGSAFINSLIFVGVIFSMTLIMVALYKFRWYRTLQGWLMISTIIIIGIFGFAFFKVLCTNFNIAMDYITAVVIVWNFTVVGVIAIHSKAPLLLKQAYLIFLSALMALTLIQRLPGWTTWVFLALISIYDIFAVLCPKGPLRTLVNTAAERQEGFMPALVYSSTILYFGTVNGNPQRSRKAIDPRRFIPTNAGQISTIEVENISSPDFINHEAFPIIPHTIVERDLPISPNEYRHNSNDGIKLGLGDFIFYSLLVGKASQSAEWTSITMAFIGILTGLLSTLFLLVSTQRALPALPISVFLGLGFYFSSRATLESYVEFLGTNQLFI